MSVDPVEAVILAYLDHLEGSAAPPSLDHLGEEDRRRARSLMDAVSGGRGIDPRASRPSIEELLADTPLAGLLPADGAAAGLVAVRDVLRGVDARARVEIDSADLDRPSVVLSHLDLRARFVLVPSASIAVTRKLRALVEAVFRDDPDTSRVGVVAARSAELTTRVVAAEDVGHTITTPRGEPHTGWDPPLPLALAARRMLEQGAPEWPAFDFDRALREPLDVAALATEVAARVIGRESGRSYRGDKRRAYRALVGHEGAFAELVARVATHASEVDLDEEITRLSRVAA
jgi:hypothetical protein